MAPASKERSTRAEVALIQLKNCLVNLPRSLVGVLLNTQTAVQDVVVEIQYQARSSQKKPTEPGSAVQRSVYVGWTGMQSKRRPASLIDRDAGRGSKEETAIVEIDMTFARTLGLGDSQKIVVLLHLDPPLAHTVHIEPLTPGDWEIIELHASFLEVNLLSQIRALPNPSFTPTVTRQTQQIHPLTLHLSPTSTANIVVSSLTPAQSSTVAFAKLSPDAEVIVAPKTRLRSTHDNGTQVRSIASVGRKSAGGRSNVSNTRSATRKDQVPKSSTFLRLVDRQFCDDFFEDDDDRKDRALIVWVDRDVMAIGALNGAEWVSVSVVRPPGLEVPLDPQQLQSQKDAEATAVGKPAIKVVAQVQDWDDAPDSQHIALSSALCSALDVEGVVGGLVRIESAPSPVSRAAVKSLSLYPFHVSDSKPGANLRIGGDKSTRNKDASAQLRSLLGGENDEGHNILDGPLTNGLILSLAKQSSKEGGWQGGLLRFDLHNAKEEMGATPSSNQPLSWAFLSDIKAQIIIREEIRNPLKAHRSSNSFAELVPSEKPTLIGVTTFVDQLVPHIAHCSPVLLTGGLGSGKSSMAKLVAHRIRSLELYYTSYLPCRKLVTEETRVSTIKETINRVFMAASWGTRFGGKALVILDDIDKLCPIETELQVGNDNGRSRQISELVCSIVRQYCGPGSGVVLLATAESKESLNKVIVGGHLVREILSLKAPNKDARRQVLQALAGKPDCKQISAGGTNGHSKDGSNGDGAAWMDGSPPNSPKQSATLENFLVHRDVDFLELAGQTDGYMPGDLVLLVARARSESLIRSVHEDSESTDTTITLTKEDFQQALKGFTPASLRNVTLQTSRTSFASIGGLHETRRVLLETLQYPTTYAPIFAQCPLRLRSGLLLYGYPGCGKTLLASAVAGECGLNFISVKGPEILNKYIGASEKSVRDLFERAESAKPCVLFFDEFDSIAPKRGHDSTGVTDRVVNQLLTQMDGAEGLSGVYVLAATSRPDLIDPALLRPGRLDKSLLCDLPGLDDRLDILQALSKTLKLKPSILASKSKSDETLFEVAHRTEGYSGADLQAVMYNAQLEAIHGALDAKSKPQSSRDKKNRDHRKSHRSSSQKPLIQFRYGDDISSDTVLSDPKQLHDNAAILAKIEDLKIATRKERQLRHGHESLQGSKKAADENKGASGDQEVVIQWKHIEASLATTRSSISVEERRRLEGIYREFVVGRNGEMPRGEGPRDVGGRSSLM